MKWTWRYWRSFFRGDVIATTRSHHHACLEVQYAHGRLVLNGANVNLSFGSLEKVFRAAFKAIRLSERKVVHVLLLGLGAGNVPAILTSLGCDCRIVGVEIDPEMIRLGRQYFNLDAHPRLEVVCMDAIAYVQAHRGDDARYDLVIVDLFIDETVPPGAETPEFLRGLADLLAPGGLLLYNRLMHTAALAELSRAFTRKMQEVLPGTRAIRADQNRILIYAHE